MVIGAIFASLILVTLTLSVLATCDRFVRLNSITPADPSYNKIKAVIIFFCSFGTLGVVFSVIENSVSCSTSTTLWDVLFWIVGSILSIIAIIVEAVINISMITDILANQKIKLRYKGTPWGRFNELIGFKRKIIGLFVLINILAFASTSQMIAVAIISSDIETFFLSGSFSIAFYTPLHFVRMTFQWLFL